MAYKLPVLVENNVLLNKSVWMGIFVTLLAMAGLGVIALTPWSLGFQIFTSASFLITLVSVVVLGYVYDAMLTPNKKVYWKQNLVGAVAFSAGLPLVLGIFGVSSLATFAGIASMATIATVVSAVVLLYAGFWISAKYWK